MKTCPFCAEEIQDAAIVCRHCQRNLAETGGDRAAPTAKSADERRTILGRQIERLAAPNMRVESRSDFQAVLVYGEKVNHLLHFLIGLFTIGLWWVVWAVLALTNKQTKRLITVDESGVTRATNY